MKVALAFLATLALAASSVSSKKNIDLMEDGTIVIRGDHGKQVKIYKQSGPHGQNNIEIQVTGPNTVTKKIEIDENNRVSIINNGEYPNTELRDDMRYSKEERGKRSFTLEEQDAVLNEIVNNDRTTFNDGTLRNTLPSQQEVYRRQLGKLDSTMPILMNKVGLDTILAKTYGMDSVMYPRWTENMERMNWININEQMNCQTTKMMTKVLLKMFDTPVLMHMLNKFGQDQIWNQNILDNILSNRGIFDKMVLMELINDSFLRNMMIRMRIFDKPIVDQVMIKHVTLHGLEPMINREVLKNWMISLGCCDRDILKQIVNEIIVDNVTSIDRMDREWLLRILDDSMMRRFLVQQGLLNTDIMEKLQYVHNKNMILGDDILRQVINKGMLRHYLMQQGFTDYSMLDLIMTNEILGLRILMKVLSLNQTPRMTFRQLVGTMRRKPEMMIDQVQTLPLRDDLVGITIKKSIFRPVMSMDDLFDTDRDLTTTHLWNILGKQGRVLSHPMMLGNSNVLPRWQGVSNQIPIVEDMM